MLFDGDGVGRSTRYERGWSGSEGIDDSGEAKRDRLLRCFEQNELRSMDSEPGQER